MLKASACNNPSITSLRNEKPQFKLALTIFYMHTPFTLWMNFLHVQMICITDLYDCVNPYTVIILCFVCFCMFLTCSASCCLVTASGICGIYICVCVCACVRVCVRARVRACARACARALLISSSVITTRFNFM